MKPICFPCPRCKLTLSIAAEKRRTALLCPHCGQSICLGPGYVRKADHEQLREHEEARRRLKRKQATKTNKGYEC